MKPPTCQLNKPSQMIGGKMDSVNPLRCRLSWLVLQVTLAIFIAWLLPGLCAGQACSTPNCHPWDLTKSRSAVPTEPRLKPFWSHRSSGRKNGLPPLNPTNPSGMESSETLIQKSHLMILLQTSNPTPGKSSLRRNGSFVGKELNLCHPTPGESSLKVNNFLKQWSPTMNYSECHHTSSQYSSAKNASEWGTRPATAKEGKDAPNALDMPTVGRHASPRQNARYVVRKIIRSKTPKNAQYGKKSH